MSPCIYYSSAMNDLFTVILRMISGKLPRTGSKLCGRNYKMQKDWVFCPLKRVTGGNRRLIGKANSGLEQRIFFCQKQVPAVVDQLSNCN